MMTKEQADRAFDVLVKHCGANELGRASFVATHLTGTPREYRFIGALGFGGKFWHHGGHAEVTCYREDETPDRLAMIVAANAALDIALCKHDPAEPVGVADIPEGER